jgi:signal transduction histidine kinase
MTHRRPRALIAYAVACAAAIGAVAARISINQLVIEILPLIAFYPAVMISGWFGGLGPGLLATSLSAASAAFLFTGASHPFLNWFGLILFVVVGVSLSALNESLHRATALEHSLREGAERALAAETITKQDAQREIQVKERVLATVSHEMRAPLHAIIGWSDVLRRSVLIGDQQQRAVEAIHRNALHQKRLIEDLTDFTRMMSGKLRLDSIPIDLSASIHAALDAIQPDAAAKHLHITLDFEPGAAIVQADPTRLQQILWNLLTNAVKFTAPAGHIGIAVRHRSATLEVVVSDSGIGISPESLPFVFEPFRQAEGALLPKSVGLGLGLAVVKQLAEAHGGTISVASDGVNRGTTFTVRLPAA